MVILAIISTSMCGGNANRSACSDGKTANGYRLLCSAFFAVEIDARATWFLYWYQ